MSKKATEKEMSALHGLMAAYFKEKLTCGEPVTAAEIGQIRQFLKDNDIVASIEQNPDMLSIAQVLPEFEADDDDEAVDEGSYH